MDNFKDEEELARMGYKQELKRDLSWLQNFGVTFSIISVITPVASLFLYGLTTGGPAVIVWSWPVVSFFTMMVGLTMAEICSAHPTSGGPYFWAAKMTTPKHAPLASWITGWFNLLGQVGVTTGISFACATFIATTLVMAGNISETTPQIIVGIYAAILVSQGLVNTFGGKLLGYLNTFSIWLHAFGIMALIIAVVSKAPTHQSATFVFTYFYDATGVPPEDGSPPIPWSQRASPGYVALIGILLAQYTLIGYDASAHMIEETRHASKSGSYGIVAAISVSSILGWFLLLGLLFSIQNWEATVRSPTGQPIAQIFLDTVGEQGAIALMVFIILCMFFCGTFSITANSRMMYAFSRDGALPGHKFWHKVNGNRKLPVRTVWLAVVLSFLLGLPSLASTVAFAAATSIATVGCYISYGIPISLRLFNPNFKQGPFNLGSFSYPVATLASTWIMFICIIFSLPQINPVTSQTFNYTTVAVGITVIYSGGFWLISARKWFTGPIRQISAEEMGAGGPGSIGSGKKEEIILTQ